MKPALIVLNGASSAGKTALAKELQSMIPALHLQIDTFADMLPISMSRRCIRDLPEPQTSQIISACHETAVSFVRAGTSVILDHVIGENPRWLADLYERTLDVPTVFVGVHCDERTLLQRERTRSDRESHVDVAVRQHASIHNHLKYDVQIDTTDNSPVLSAQRAMVELEALNISSLLAENDVDSGVPNERTLTPHGCVQVYTGDGKGKTTASVGLAARAAGAGLRVFIGQFIKGGDSSEMALLRKRCPEVDVEQFGNGRFIKANPSESDMDKARRGVQRLYAVLTSRQYDVVIADEANGAAAAGVITTDDILSLVDARPAEVELVITGRSADSRVLDRADVVTEMKKIKHCFDEGIPAREGIEY